MAISNVILRSRCVLYSIPRNIAVCPRCRANPWASQTVMRDMPAFSNAACTAASRVGCIMATTNFIRFDALSVGSI